MAALRDSGRTTQHGKQLGTVSYHFPLVHACIFLGKLDRRVCRAFPSFCGYFTLGDGLRSRASPAHHPAAKQETCWKVQGGFCRGDFTIQFR